MLNVEECPRILDSEISRQVNNGESTYMTCTAKAVHQLEFSWYKNGVKLCHDGRISITNTRIGDEVESSLQLLYPSLEDQVNSFLTK